MKLARMTRGWHLVDPVTCETIDVSLTIENAEEVLLAAAGVGLLRPGVGCRPRY